MLFHEIGPDSVLAISQPAHAWISGQLLRAWADALDEPLLLAAALHDLAWLDWEAAPSLDPSTGRPHLFRHVGAAIHAPLWSRGVERALAAWGRHVALLLSRHGSLIYDRYTDRHRMSAVDADAVEAYRRAQEPRQASWARGLGLDDAAVQRESALVAFSDTLSLALCGELRTPLDLQAPDRAGAMQPLRLEPRAGDPASFTLSPWPFREDSVAVECEARPLRGRLADEAALRSWLEAPDRDVFRARLHARA